MTARLWGLDWIKQGVEHLEQLIHSSSPSLRFPFTSDDVRSRIESVCGEAPAPNYWGCLFQTAARRGLIVSSNQTVRSTRPEARGRRIPLWRAA